MPLQLDLCNLRCKLKAVHYSQELAIFLNDGNELPWFLEHLICEKLGLWRIVFDLDCVLFEVRAQPLFEPAPGYEQLHVQFRVAGILDLFTKIPNGCDHGGVSGSNGPSTGT